MKNYMSKLICLVLALSMALTCLSFSIAEETVEMRTVTDLEGNELQVPADPQRIAILPDAICTLAWLLMGGSDRMVTLTESSKNDWTNYLGKELFPDMADIPAGIEKNIEELVSYDPDLVIAMTGDYYADQVSQLRALGYEVYMIPSASLYGDPVGCISAMGDLLGCEERAAQLIGYMQETDSYIEETMETVTEGTGKRLYNTVWVDDMKAWTAGSFNGAIIGALKCENISDNEASSTAFTMEEIIAYDPEFVFISFPDYTTNEFYNNAIPGQDWSTITAVKEGHVYRAPAMVQRWAQSFSAEKFLYKRWMASIVYPEVFPMEDTVAYIKAYLKDFYGYEISDETFAACMNSEENNL